MGDGVSTTWAFRLKELAEGPGFDSPGRIRYILDGLCNVRGRLGCLFSLGFERPYSTFITSLVYHFGHTLRRDDRSGPAIGGYGLGSILPCVGLYRR